jgi:hypothetical protein
LFLIRGRDRSAPHDEVREHPAHYANQSIEQSGYSVVRTCFVMLRAADVRITDMFSSMSPNTSTVIVSMTHERMNDDCAVLDLLITSIIG